MWASFGEQKVVEGLNKLHIVILVVGEEEKARSNKWRERRSFLVREPKDTHGVTWYW